MTKRRKLDEEEIQAALHTLNGWSFTKGKLHRVFEFTDFAAAFAFMTAAALHAERMGHHPDWSNSYRRVDVNLTTHDLGGLSTLDVELATRMNDIAGRMT